jgi:hypothetical protein
MLSSYPKAAEAGFKELSSLDEEVFQGILKGFLTVPARSSTFDLAIEIADLLSIDRKTLERIFSSIEGLFSIVDEESDFEQVVKDVISISLSRELIKTEEAEQLAKRLLALLQEKKIYYASKATNLMTENGNFFFSCRVLTDLRPVFDFNVEDVPKAGIIMHTLHIHYQEHSEAPHKDFYITLEPNDLDTLIDVLSRAQAKGESLSAIFAKAGMSNLNGE